MKKLLMIPGPTMLSKMVLEALSSQMCAHRTEAFGDYVYEIREDLKKVYQTENEIHIISGSSTSGMDAAISSWISPGDKVIVPVYGKFSARFRQIIQSYGGQPLDIQLPWGQAPILPQIKSLYSGEVKAVAVVQNETSSGVRVDLSRIGDFLSDKDGLLIVDAVSSMGGDDIPVDEWKVDMCVAGTQKAFGCPPGLSMISVSEKAWGLMEDTSPRSYYLDLRRYRSRDRRSKGQTPFTQSESLLFALRAALDEIMEEGVQARFERHRNMAQLARRRVTELGFELFPPLEKNYSRTLTAIKMPRSMSATEIQSRMDREHDIIVATGHEDYKENIIRIAHLGSTTLEDVNRTMDAFEEVTRAMGTGN